MALVVATSVLAVGGTAVGCGGGGGGTIRIDGSSTVAPLSEAAAEQFQAEHHVPVTVGTSGTGGGLARFCRGETDIADASRPIKDDEVAACSDSGVTFEELTVANDGLSVVINPENDWAGCLTTDQLRTIWDRGSDVDNWNQVDPSFPDEPLELFGPGTDSGTFDFFSEAINGEGGRQRSDYNNVGEDDNATVTGVSGSRGGMGYLGFSFVQENADKVVAAEIDSGQGCVAPNAETVQAGEYEPLGRPLFVYPSGDAVARQEVHEFLQFYIDENDSIAAQALLIPLADDQRTAARRQIASLASRVAGRTEATE